MPKPGSLFRRALYAIAGGALAIGLLTAGTPAAPAGPPGSSPGEVERSWRVTLVTGDTVRVEKTARGYRAEPTPAKGREHISLGIRQLGDDIEVYPSDAVPLVMNGTLDRRLFEVTGLVEDGLHDAATPELRLIVEAAELPTTARVARSYDSIGAKAVRIPKTGAPGFWNALRDSAMAKPPRTPKSPRSPESAARPRVWLDGKVRASLDQSVPQVGAPKAWKSGLTGQGIRVAVLDSGIDTDHPDLEETKVVAERDFTWTETPDDRFGHGTHVAATIAGTGAASGGRYTGVAPGAELVNAKVLDDIGWGWTSDIIAGMEWAVEQDADVVNLSLGGGGDGYGTDPLSLAVNRLTESSGTLFVVAAGNDGEYGERTIAAPGDADRALTVAATNRDRTTAEFSSRGPRFYDRALKPDLAAPGVGIVAALATGTEIGEPVDAHHTSLSGTSMSTPHVAGAAALLAQRHPNAGADRLKALLMGSARQPVSASVFEQGAGFLNIARAVEQPAWVAGGSVSAFLDWPHEEPAVKQVTYHNDGDRPLALRLSFAPTDSAGRPAPKGLFRMPKVVVIPAGGSRTIPLTVDSAKAALGTQYQGTILARGRGTTIRTPVAAHVEDEKYDVTFEYIDRNGEPVTAVGEGHFADLPIIVNIETGEAVRLHMADGKLVARVPRGRYTAAEHILTWNGEELASSTLVAAPEIVVDSDTTVRLDARDAEPVRFTGDVAAAEPEFVMTNLLQAVGDYTFYSQFRDRSGQSELYVLGTEPVADRACWFTGYVHLIGSDGTRYALVDGERGRLPADPTYSVDAGTLADLTVEFAAAGDEPLDGLVSIGGHLVVDGQWLPLLGAGPWVRPPDRMRVLVTTEAFGTSVPWDGRMEAYLPSNDLAYDEDLPSRTYRPGERRTLRFSGAAWGPGAYAYHQSDGVLGVVTCPACPGTSEWAWYLGETGPEGRIVLKRDGETIAERDAASGIRVENLTGTATYTVELTARHELGHLAYAREVSGRWTFQSSPAPDGVDDRVTSLIDAQVTGPFDLRGRAAPGTVLPLTIDLDGGDQATIGTPELAISYDGESWEALDVRRVDGRWVAETTTPEVDQAFASLRLQASDGAGNAVDLTTRRAFQVHRDAAGS